VKEAGVQAKAKKKRDSSPNSQSHSLEHLLRMSIRQVAKLRVSRWKSEEEEEVAEEKATDEEEAKDKEQAEATGRVPRRLLLNMPTRLVVKLWVTGRIRSSGLQLEKKRRKRKS
jgi:hypothetical protein